MGKTFPNSKQIEHLATIESNAFILNEWSNKKGKPKRIASYQQKNFYYYIFSLLFS